MGWSTFYTLRSLLKAGRKIAPDCTTVSFDIFDTLLIRRIHDPDMVKPATARYIAARAKLAGLSWSWAKVQKLRDSIEKEQRRETSLSFEDHEACYPDFMQQVLHEIFGKKKDDALLQYITDFELAMENSMLVPRADLVTWLKELHGLGKRILLVSDIYLPAAHLERLVDHAGFLPYVDQVISSADTFLAKASGKAFPLLKKRFGLDYARWLHIGDNPHSDGLKPAELGIKSLVLRDSDEKFRKAIVKRYIHYSAGQPFWKGRAVQQLMLPLEAENIPRSSLYIAGYTFLAPVLSSFVLGLAERCVQKGIKRLFFFSREGWLLERIWQAITPVHFPETDLPEISYLYVSRMALAGATCARQGLTRENADIVFLPPGNRDFRDVCRVFGLQIEGLVSHLKRYGLLEDTVLSDKHEGFVARDRLRFNELLEDEEFQQEIRQQTDLPGQAVEKYLEQEGFFDHSDVALVDIGWLGTIQRFLFEAVKHRSDTPCFHGYLLGATRGIPFPTSSRNTIEGVVYDGDRFDLAGSTILYARDLFEEACRAPHPTLNGYRLHNQKCELVFRQQDDDIGMAEQVQDKYFHPLQEGIVDGAARYVNSLAVLGFSLGELKPWLNYLLVSRLAFPKAEEVRDIRQLHHLDDFHGSHKPLASLEKKNMHLWDYPIWVLRWNPWIRLKFFLMTLRERLRG